MHPCSSVTIVRNLDCARDHKEKILIMYFPVALHAPPEITAAEEEIEMKPRSWLIVRAHEQAFNRRYIYRCNSPRGFRNWINPRKAVDSECLIRYIQWRAERIVFIVISLYARVHPVNVHNAGQNSISRLPRVIHVMNHILSSDWRDQ